MLRDRRRKHRRAGDQGEDLSPDHRAGSPSRPIYRMGRTVVPQRKRSPDTAEGGESTSPDAAAQRAIRFPGEGPGTASSQLSLENEQ